jgi:hypothetical protein
MNIRIGVIGSGGVGKSGLAEAIAGKLDVRYVSSKSITRPILERKGFNWSSGQPVEEFLAQEECQNEILSKSIEIEDSGNGFVTDRTSIDLAAYAIVMLHRKVQLVDEIVEVCRQRTSKYTHLILCPWGQQTIERNDVRTLNPWFQFMVHGVMMALLRQWELKHIVLTESGPARIRQAMDYISPKRRV